MFHKRVCKGLWGAITQSTQMEGTPKQACREHDSLKTHTQTHTHNYDTKAVGAPRHIFAKYSMLSPELPEPGVRARRRARTPL